MGLEHCRCLGRRCLFAIRWAVRDVQEEWLTGANPKGKQCGDAEQRCRRNVDAVSPTVNLHIGGPRAEAEAQNEGHPSEDDIASQSQPERECQRHRKQDRVVGDHVMGNQQTHRERKRETRGEFSGRLPQHGDRGDPNQFRHRDEHMATRRSGLPPLPMRPDSLPT